MNFEPCNKNGCVKGYIYHGDLATKCDCLKRYQEKTIISLGLVRANVLDKDIPSLSQCKGNAESIAKIRVYISRLSDSFRRGAHLYLVGPNGTQKTYTSKAIIQEAIKQKLKCKFVLMNDLLVQLTDIFEKELSSETDSFYTCDLLVIDDSFDPKKVTLFKSGYQIPYLDAFLRKRIEMYQGNTIFTSNIKINDINEDKFSKDIKNLLQRSILNKQGELYFNDVYSSIDNQDILSMWN